MTKLVLDASCGVKWVVPETGSGHAQCLRDAYADGRLVLLAPDLYVAEVTNILWKKACLREEISSDDMRAALRLLLASLPELFDSAPLAEQALNLAAVHRRSVHDCLYVALALQERCQLVTADAALVHALGPVLGNVLDLESAAELL